MTDVSAKPSTNSAVVTTTPSAVVTSGGVGSSAAEKNKQWQRELLMERIRSHAQHKSFAELSKAMRMSMLEKRYGLDAVEKANLQKCLDSMQHCIKVTSRQGLVERLESLSRQLGLKFMEDTSGLFISTDMFFLEIILDESGALTDVKVHHECKIEQQSCSELVNCLNRGDFADFTVQLEGLSSIYQLNAEPKVKTKAFVALQAMETDLYQLYQAQSFSKDTQQVLADSSVGLVLQRRGGHPMRLTYFVSPYDLISLETRSLQPLSLELITAQQFGLSVTVNLEASSANKLQILPLVTFPTDGGAESNSPAAPIYASLTQQNSMLLPATFVLRLNKPLPVCNATLRALGLTAAIADNLAVAADSASPQSKATAAPAATIMNLIVQTASEQQLRNSQKGLFVCLPDQTHCYFFSENKQLQASLVSSVPFTEPSQVPKILDFLKKQALFYTLLSSCVRSQSKMGNDMDMTTILEVNAISFQQISVSLQHPYEESMATLEFDLRDAPRVNCAIFSLSRNYEPLSLKLTAIVQKSLSIPVTIRSLLKYWDQERMKMFQLSISGGGGPPSAAHGSGGFGNFNLAMGTNDPGGSGGGCGEAGGGGTTNASTGGSGTIKIEPNTRQVASAAASAPATAAPPGSVANPAAAAFFKYKSEVKQEDFHESPKSQTQATTTTMTVTKTTAQSSVEAVAAAASSLGYNQHQQQPQKLQQPQLQKQEQTNAKASDIEIADKYKNIWKDKTPTLKNCVSITPISSNEAPTQPAKNASLDVKRTGGIEIIPLTSAQTASTTTNAPPTNPASSAASTITITPINASTNATPTSGNNGNGRDKKSAATVAASTVKRDAGADVAPLKEKKRKKKRDDSPMGPPEKVYSRQNSPAALGDAVAVGTAARKFSSPTSSPKGNSSGSGAGAGGAGSVVGSTRPSPKHSPVYSSPKHQSGGGSGTASNSPKSPFAGTHSPKHGSSGKPSMSTLKSAAATAAGDKCAPAINLSGSGGSVAATAAALVRTLSGSAAVNAVATSSTSSSSSSPAKTSRSGGGEKEKASVVAVNAVPAVVKSSSSLMGVTAAGMQQFKAVASLNHLAAASSVGSLGSFGSSVAAVGVPMDLGMAAAQMRKSVAAAGAVSLMTSTEVTPATTTAATHQPQQQHQRQQQQQQHGSNETVPPTISGGALQTITSSPLSSATTTTTNTSSEYMVKSSQQGLKLTINKTSSSKSSTALTTTTTSTKSKNSYSSTSSSSKKQHTGLKPGVNSGPASKKSPATPSSPSNSSSSSLSAKNSSSSSSGFPSSQSTKHIFQKSNSSGNLSAKLSAAAGGGASSSHGLSRSNSTSSFGSTASVGNKKLSASASSAAMSGGTSAASTRFDHHVDMMKILQYASPTMAASMEGFMKGLNAKFQIPKLSQRVGAAAATTTTGVTTAATITSAAAAAAKTTVNTTSPIKNNASASIQPQQSPHKIRDKKSSASQASSVSRSPPPPYYAAIGAASSLPQSRTTSTSPSLSPSSVSMHILKSSMVSPPASLPTVSFGSEQQQNQKPSLPDYNLPKVDEALLASFTGK